MLNCELATGSRSVRPLFRYNYVSKPDLKVGNVDSAEWEALAADCSKWRLAIRAGIQGIEKRRKNLWEKRRTHRQQKATSAIKVATGKQTVHMWKLSQIADWTTH